LEDATLGIRPPIGVGVANGNVADIVPGTNEVMQNTKRNHMHADRTRHNIDTRR
jgi:hypothetical protein